MGVYAAYAASAMMAFMLLANHWARDAIGAVEGELRDELGVTRDLYVSLVSAYFAPSIFVPVLTGTAAQALGAGSVIIPVAVFAMLGHIVFGTGVSAEQFPAMLAGRIMAGAVYEAMDMLPLPFLAPLVTRHWATVCGLINGTVRLGSVMSFVVTPAVATSVSLKASMLLACGVGSSSCVFAVLGIAAAGQLRVAFGLKRGSREDQDGTQGLELEGSAKLTSADDGDGAELRSARSIARWMLSRVANLGRVFGLFSLFGVCVYSAVVPFWFVGGSVLQNAYGLELEVADRLMALPEGCIMLLSTPVGVLCDRFEVSFARKLQAMGVAALGLAVSLLNLALRLLPPVFNVALLGSSYAICNVLIWGCFPEACPRGQEGLGSGLLASGMNCGAAFVPVLLALVRARAPEEAQLLVLAAFAALAAATAAVAAASTGAETDRKTAHGETRENEQDTLL
mmetsp:Transcript_13678/g.44998  ORF Transcript_13678/g.44998 Transcript_13678/m.44998 type:complete len:454 (-) Transcript_13678:91-1452(-)